jgi:hypothetical protein
MAPTGALRNEHGFIVTKPIRVFGLAIRVIWLAVVVATVLTELLPAPKTTPLPFYLYVGSKAVCFVLVGYLAPLSFWQFNALNRGILYAALSALLVESAQAVIGNGHRFHWYELLIKLVLLLVGFTLALDARYERAIRLGPLVLPFAWPSHYQAKEQNARATN